MAKRDKTITSFAGFFRRRLMPVLARFERTRRRRLPVLLFVLCVFSGAVLWCLHTFWSLVPELGLLFTTLGAATLLLLVTSMVMAVAFPDLLYRGMKVRANTTYSVALLIVPIRTAETVLGIIGVLDHYLFRNASRKLAFSVEVVRPTVEFALPGFTHRPVEYVGQGDFLDSRLYGFNVGRYGGRDYFFGRHNGVDMRFSWLRAESIGSDRSVKKYELLFSGWYFVVPFHRHFEGEVLVRPDVAEAAMGWFGRSLQEFTAPAGMHLIHLEDVEFEKRFIVHASGQLEARYILSPTMMRALTAFQKRLGAPLSISFRKECMFAAADAPVEYFGMLPVQSFTDPLFTRHLYHAVKGVADLADDLMRNHRLWHDDILQ